MGLIGLGRARDALEAIVGCSVDLIPAADLEPGVRDNVEAEAIARQLAEIVGPFAGDSSTWTQDND